MKLKLNQEMVITTESCNCYIAFPTKKGIAFANDLYLYY